MRIPFNKPFIVGKELYYIAQSVASGHIAGDGVFTRKCGELLEGRLGAARVLLTPSCTAALEMAAMLIDAGPGDEVIMPSYTFVSTANAFHLRGARPVFADIRPDTLNIDPALVEEAVTERTKAVVAVHYAGVGCDMDAITETASARGLHVIEDAAQALGASYRGRPLGTIGALGALSFHETKNFICGEGGALVINDGRFVERAEILREKGTDRSRFFRGEVDRYTWVDIGSSYLPSDLQAAFLYAQLENMDAITTRRGAIYRFYEQELSVLEAKGLARLPRLPAECAPNHHLFYLIVEDETTRDGLIAHLKSRGILAVFHYVPLHLSKVGRRLGYREGMLPVTEDLSRRLVRLPFFYSITEAEQAEVAREIKTFLGA
ncbi:MAG TPA: dTDP-4-amino-4,6-dideoxygalactose transaminase [Deltaproteobacteria bacterium]|nr:dTDP-4-amino-4,6-dideoxygalactose transaminase [Deltaproteobacteria bacterium]